jgi:DNA polymerase III subunit delta
MKISIDRLASQLEKTLAPIYMVSGDETLLVEEAGHLIRQTAETKGFTERQIFNVDNRFNWNQLLESANTLSLFNDKSLLELRLPSGKINEAGKKALLTYVENPRKNKILFITAGKLTGPTQNTKWFKALEKNGVFVQIWPITPQQLPNWIQLQLRKLDISTTSDAIKFLAESVEGNLLAAKQEIEKLSLLYDKKQLSLDEVITAISDNARYDVFTLADSALSGDSKRTLKILIGLKNEGAEPTLMLWALTKEIRTLITMAQQLTQGDNLDNVLYKNRVWEKKKPIVRLALKRHNSNTLLKLLYIASQIDRVIKGVEPGNAWDLLNKLALRLAR